MIHKQQRVRRQPEHGGSNHFMCDRCWERAFTEKGRRVGTPTKFSPPHDANCCFCGSPAGDVIPYGEPANSERLACKPTCAFRSAFVDGCCVMLCSCGFRATGDAWSDAGRALDMHLCGPLDAEET